MTSTPCHSCQREFELRSADDNGRSLRARTLKQSGYKCSNCDIKVAGSQVLGPCACAVLRLLLTLLLQPGAHLKGEQAR